MRASLPLHGFFAIMACLPLTSVLGKPSKFTRSEALADYYLLEWEVDLEHKNVTFQVKARTTGYVGFGVNTIGGMHGADIVIGGVFDNGTAYFSDRHGLGSFLPPEDKSQDWFLLDGHEADGWTTIKFARVFHPCDQKDDVQLTNGTLRVIFAVGATDDIDYHAERGTKSLILLSQPSLPVDVSTLESWKVTANTRVPDVDSVYWVTVHKSPKFTSKVHMVGFQTRIESEAAEKYTHHMILYGCPAQEGVNLTEVLGPLVGQPGAKWDDPSMLHIRQFCPTFMYVWAKGGSPLRLPKHVGIPIGKSSQEEYFLMIVHYDNPWMDSGVQFETGVTIHFTRKLRAFDAGVLYTGTTVDAGYIIPPNVAEFVHAGHCSGDCTRAKFPSGGINVISVLLHAHLSGRKVRVRHFRESKELHWIANDENYDFNYQQDRPMTNEVKVLPGDHLVVECSYDSTWRSPPSAVYGGESTRHEMCQAYILYYPLLQDLDRCASTYHSLGAILKPLGIDAIDSSNDTEYPIVTGPEGMKGLTLMDALNTKVNWTSGLRDELQYKTRWAPQRGVCRSYVKHPSNIFRETAYPNASTYMPAFICERRQN